MALLFTSYSSNAQVLDPTQTYTTGNIVTNTNQGGPSSWVNGVYQNSLTCWSGGMSGYCGPNAIVRPGNNINFSYGLTDLHQVQSIANALPNSGTGLVVKGFNFGFTAKNGNGWDDGRQDYLTAYVNFYKTDGSLAENYDYGSYTNRKYNWTTFNFSETFKTPYASQDLSSVRYGFVGRDNNFWAGPYGPEINNISFSLKYSVDPCSVDTLSSPSCPGYLDAITRLSPNTTINEPVASTTIASPNTIAVTPTTVSAPEVSSAPVAPTNSTNAPAPIASSSASSSSTPSATNPQPKVGEITVSGSPAKTLSTSQILSIVRSEQNRIGSLETNVAQQAAEQAQAASDKAQQESLTISSATVTQSQTSAQAAVSTLNTNSQNSSTTNNAQNNTTGSVANQNVNRNGNVINIKPPEIEVTVVQPVITKPQNIYSLTTPAFNLNNDASSVSSQNFSSFNRNEISKSQNEEVLKMDEMKFNSTNPIFNIVNSPPQTQTQTVESKTTTSVNSQVQDNDIAGAVSLSMLAKQPRGFDTYGGVLTDVSFYPPKEIYRNQRVVDNNRALRQLSSDRLHEEMVNQQYRN